MYCSNCGCSSAKEVVLFSSVAIDCWACNLNAEVRRRLLDASESFTITLPVPEPKLSYPYTIYYDWVEK